MKTASSIETHSIPGGGGGPAIESIDTSRLASIWGGQSLDAVVGNLTGSNDQRYQPQHMRQYLPADWKGGFASGQASNAWIQASRNCFVARECPGNGDGSGDARVTNYKNNYILGDHLR